MLDCFPFEALSPIKYTNYKCPGSLSFLSKSCLDRFFTTSILSQHGCVETASLLIKAFYNSLYVVCSYGELHLDEADSLKDFFSG